MERPRAAYAEVASAERNQDAPGASLGRQGKELHQEDSGRRDASGASRSSQMVHMRAARTSRLHKPRRGALGPTAAQEAASALRCTRAAATAPQTG